MKLVQIILALSSMLILLATPSAHAQNAERVTIQAIDAADFPSVAITISYADSLGNGLPPPTAANVSVRVDGEPVETPHKAITTVEQPVAVALILDTSAAMGDASTPHATRIQDALRLSHALLDRLPPGSLIGLITFADKANLVLPLSTDGGRVRNVLDTVAPMALSATATALTQALSIALDQFSAYPDHVGLLVMYTAGLAEGSPDVQPLLQKIEAADQAPRVFTIIELAAAPEPAGSPAAPLAVAASALGGEHLHFAAGSLAELADRQTAVLRRYDGILARRRFYRLEIELPALTPGEHRLDLSIKGQASTASFQVGPARPRLTVHTSNPTLTHGARLTTTIDFVQTKVLTVEYVLDDVRIGISTKGPDYALELVGDAAQRLKRYDPQVEHSLYAAATDDTGLSGRSAPIPVRVAPPGANWWISGALVALAILLTAIAAAFYVRRQRQPTPRQPQSQSQPSSPIETPTERYSGGVSERYGGGATERYQPGFSDTERYGEPSPARLPVYTVEYRVNGQVQRTRLDKRQMTIGRDPSNDIEIRNRYVSSNHARLTLTERGVQIFDLNSTNGTFLYSPSERNRLPAGAARELQDGDSVWIGPEVELIVRREDR